MEQQTGQNQDKEFEIIVNGRSVTISAKELTFDEIKLRLHSDIQKRARQQAGGYVNRG